MNLIQRIFSPAISRKINGNAYPEHPAETGTEISERLFIDNEPPVPGQFSTVPENHVSIFIGKDYYNPGRSDGYRYHSSEMLESKCTLIRAEFMIALDKESEEKRRMLLQLSEERTDVNRISGTITEKIDSRIAELGKSIARYEREKELAAENKGWVAKPIGEYREGFLRGLADYNEARNFGNKFGLFI